MTAEGFKGPVLRRGHVDYEKARHATVWRENTPLRFPTVIVRAECVEDVAAAVRLAEAEGLSVGVRSGGHSWTSPHLRDASLLIDLDAMRDIEIDPATRTAWVRPAVKGRHLNDALAEHGLMAPTGHHDTVACGGFLMCGGFGWNFRHWGNGCRNVVEIEFVNAKGEVLIANDHQNEEYFWAARGGGAGFFGVVTRFRVKAYPRPACLRANGYAFPMEVMEEALHWAYSIKDTLPTNCEFLGSWTSWDPETGDWAPTRFALSGLMFAETEEEAEAVARIFDSCPVKDKALMRRRNEPTTLEERYAASTMADPPGFRFAADNVYTDLPAEKIVPLVRAMVESMPTPRSHIFWCFNGPRPDFSGMALSAWGETYFAAYSIWEDPAQDKEMRQWVVDAMRMLDPIANGEAQMNDENMEAHPQNYLTPDKAARLEELRARHDPDGRFLSYLTPGRS
ncbi:MAG: FAD-dependent oxidoreductase [Sphingobium sp.]